MVRGWGEVRIMVEEGNENYLPIEKQGGAVGVVMPRFALLPSGEVGAKVGIRVWGKVRVRVRWDQVVRDGLGGRTCDLFLHQARWE